MENLIGTDITRATELAGTKNVAVHLYGKAEIKTGRKMGHFNRIMN
jgi:5-(carboxyamino)imidazole ribonucleotide synthase